MSALIDLTTIQTALQLAPTIFFAAFAVFGLFLIARAALAVTESASNTAEFIAAILVLVAVGIVGLWLVQVF